MFEPDIPPEKEKVSFERLSTEPSTQKEAPPSRTYALGAVRTTVIGLDKSKHPSKSSVFNPPSRPTRPSSYDKCHTKQVPTPASSKSTPNKAFLVGGIPKMLFWSSVTTNVLFEPDIPPEKEKVSFESISADPSTQKVAPPSRT